MVKVIVRREPDADAPRRVDCGRCRSTLEFASSEARVDYAGANAALVIDCPVCGADLWIAVVADLGS